MSDGYDLDINNYSYQDILNLFSITGTIDRDALRSARRIALMTHPDKSSLSPEVYDFYNRAYKVLYNIYEISTKERSADSRAIDSVGGDRIWKAIGSSDKFSEKFNELFDQYKKGMSEVEDDDGYGEWLAGDVARCPALNSISDMHKNIQKRKAELGELIPKPEIESLNVTYGSSLLGGKENYDSDMFTELSYGDVKEAYEVSLIPDYGENKRDYSTLKDLTCRRDSDDRESTKLFGDESVLNQEKARAKESDMCKLYDLAKADETSRWLQEQLSTRFLQINEK